VSMATSDFEKVREVVERRRKDEEADSKDRS
jgi:hypothetical protein